jgi:hypothetical protein
VIFGKVGRIGHGKTMRAVVDAVAMADRRGVPLAANIRVRRPSGGEVIQLPMDGFSAKLGELLDELYACDSCSELDDWGDVAHGGAGCERSGLVLLVDEVDTIWDAREWADMSKLDRFRIKQSRKLGCDVFWTAQFVDQVEKSLRNITEEVGLLRAYPNPTLTRRERGKRPWLLIESRFRPGADKRLGRQLHRYRRAHEQLYNTDELVRPDADQPGRSSRRRRSTPQSAPIEDPRPQAVPSLQIDGLTVVPTADARSEAGGGSHAVGASRP